MDLDSTFGVSNSDYSFRTTDSTQFSEQIDITCFSLDVSPSAPFTVITTFPLLQSSTTSGSSHEFITDSSSLQSFGNHRITSPISGFSSNFSFHMDPMSTTIPHTTLSTPINANLPVSNTFSFSPMETIGFPLSSRSPGSLNDSDTLDNPLGLTPSLLSAFPSSNLPLQFFEQLTDFPHPLTEPNSEARSIDQQIISSSQITVDDFSNSQPTTNQLFEPPKIVTPPLAPVAVPSPPTVSAPKNVLFRSSLSYLPNNHPSTESHPESSNNPTQIIQVATQVEQAKTMPAETFHLYQHFQPGPHTMKNEPVAPSTHSYSNPSAPKVQSSNQRFYFRGPSQTQSVSNAQSGQYLPTAMTTSTSYDTPSFTKPAPNPSQHTSLVFANTFQNNLSVNAARPIPQPRNTDKTINAQLKHFPVNHIQRPAPPTTTPFQPPLYVPSNSLASSSRELPTLTSQPLYSSQANSERSHSSNHPVGILVAPEDDHVMEMIRSLPPVIQPIVEQKSKKYLATYYNRLKQLPNHEVYRGVFLGSLSQQRRTAWISSPDFPDNVFCDLRKLPRDELVHAVVGGQVHFNIALNSKPQSYFAAENPHLVLTQLHLPHSGNHP
ncbi:hypothetical protein BLNAU_12584 [Blattamonas nauphoetae]|uniref:Uncharacterized protein n=1 Tax=Blattamonas nauphoetae TaxID=2049346 RepID=A0ABQ9XJ74_9EUKA|nr:hypothetical protein BLNAU_12584 [Blattamonas nauphoetae]